MQRPMLVGCHIRIEMIGMEGSVLGLAELRVCTRPRRAEKALLTLNADNRRTPVRDDPTPEVVADAAISSLSGSLDMAFTSGTSFKV